MPKEFFFGSHLAALPPEILDLPPFEQKCFKNVQIYTIFGIIFHFYPFLAVLDLKRGILPHLKKIRILKKKKVAALRWAGGRWSSQVAKGKNRVLTWFEDWSMVTVLSSALLTTLAAGFS